MLKRIIIAILVIAVIAGLAAGGWWAWTTYGDTEAEPEVLGGSGLVEADTMSVSSVIAGRIVEVFAEEGSEVTSGTALFVLDSALLDLQVKQAEAGVKAARAQLDQVKVDKGTQAELDQAQARVDQAQAALDMATTQAGFAKIDATGDGIVTSVNAAAGENASPGRTLATITDLASLYVSIYVPETLIAQVSIGDEASVTSEASTNTFAGTVTYIASEAEFTPSNIETKDQRVKLVYEVRLDVTDATGTLKPGMPVDVTF
jgi:HlyD family secretion protein